MNIVETSKDAAHEYCAREDIALPNLLKINGNVNSFWEIKTQQCVGILYGYKGKGKVVLLDLLSKYPTERFVGVIRDWIYRLKQAGVVVESQIVGLQLEKNAMLLPASIDEVLKAVNGQSIR